MMKHYFVPLIVIFLPMLLQAQGKIETTFETSNGKIIIYYQLNADPDLEYDVSVLLKRSSDGSYSYAPDGLTGDVGRGKFAQNKRSVTWILKSAEMSMLDGDDFYFEVTAVPVEVKKGASWLYYVGGILVGGGVAAAVILNKKSQDESSTINGNNNTGGFPTPPGRP